MKKLITVLCAASILAASVPAVAVSGSFPELTLAKASPLEVGSDGYISYMRSGTTASELCANFCDGRNVTVTAKDGDPFFCTIVSAMLICS